MKGALVGRVNGLSYGLPDFIIICAFSGVFIGFGFPVSVLLGMIVGGVYSCVKDIFRVYMRANLEQLREEEGNNLNKEKQS